jgi:hypothetical protein
MEAIKEGMKRKEGKGTGFQDYLSRYLCQLAVRSEVCATLFAFSEDYFSQNWYEPLNGGMIKLYLQGKKCGIAFAHCVVLLYQDVPTSMYISNIR